MRALLLALAFICAALSHFQTTAAFVLAPIAFLPSISQHGPSALLLTALLVMRESCGIIFAGRRSEDLRGARCDELGAVEPPGRPADQAGGLLPRLVPLQSGSSSDRSRQFLLLNHGDKQSELSDRNHLKVA